MSSPVLSRTCPLLYKPSRKSLPDGIWTHATTLVGCSTTELLGTLWQARVKLSSYEPARGCVAARCGSSQYPQFDPCTPKNPQDSSVVEHPTIFRRVVGSNPIWDSDFFIYLFIYYLFIYLLFIHLFIIYSFIYYLFIYLSIYLSIYLCNYLYIYSFIHSFVHWLVS